jgi:hypothetical protein
MKIGDKVKITDGSYAVEIGSYEPWYASIGLSTEDFEVIRSEVTPLGPHLITSVSKVAVHDIYIRSTVTRRVYLHSSSMVRNINNICPSCKRPLE